MDCTYTLVTDGSSDRAIMPIIEWMIRETGFTGNINSYWADLRGVVNPPKTLSARLRVALDLYPCDVLFIHRDAERESVHIRVEEIQSAVVESEINIPVIPVVPKRMQEAWLLFSSDAIKKASGNPNSAANLNLPSMNRIEGLPDPKNILHTALQLASGRSGRALHKFSVNECAIRVPQYISDFSPLRGLTAFQLFEDSVTNIFNDLEC